MKSQIEYISNEITPSRWHAYYIKGMQNRVQNLHQFPFIVYTISSHIQTYKLKQYSAGNRDPGTLKRPE
jgi:hypothetical protein